MQTSQRQSLLFLTNLHFLYWVALWLAIFSELHYDFTKHLPTWLRLGSYQPLTSFTVLAYSWLQWSSHHSTASRMWLPLASAPRNPKSAKVMPNCLPCQCWGSAMWPRLEFEWHRHLYWSGVTAILLTALMPNSRLGGHNGIANSRGNMTTKTHARW